MSVQGTLLLGATSILGFAIARAFPESVLPFVTPRKGKPSGAGLPVMQLHKQSWIDGLARMYPRAAVLYCHAVCDVPKCEAAPDWAWQVNVTQLESVLNAVAPEARFVYISSDHVFGGDGVYHEDSPPCPISVYGRTRLEAERLVLNRANSLVIRIGLPIGPSPDGRTGHADWLRYRVQRDLPVTIVHDEHRSAVWAADLAERVVALALSAATGLHHVTATRAVSRVQLADHLLSLAGFRATFQAQSRHERSAPHLGHVELATIHRGPLSEPLPCVLDGVARVAESSGAGTIASRALPLNL